MDRVSKEKRGEIMRKVRGKNTSPELAVRKMLFSQGYRYRLHAKSYCQIWCSGLDQAAI
ncbi:hypothetical protein [Methylomonas sp. DH-1]|uniref:hypothetical protein n=1 Tax=Methylomonas sp. (strain DH-1) TaxID=1727196 RepID=UPI0009EE93C1|nr:hypothetical protein [Methylomonas sp. DH-1]